MNKYMYYFVLLVCCNSGLAKQIFTLPFHSWPSHTWTCHLWWQTPDPFSHLVHIWPVINKTSNLLVTHVQIAKFTCTVSYCRGKTPPFRGQRKPGWTIGSDIQKICKYTRCHSHSRPSWSRRQRCSLHVCPAAENWERRAWWWHLSLGYPDITQHMTTVWWQATQSD